MTPFNIVVPARYASTRLPAKPLADIAGRSMLQRVWERANMAGAERVLIATDDERIFIHAQAFGADVLMTRADHPSGTDRLHEVATQVGWPDDAIVVNVQGDEPLIPAAVVVQVAEVLALEAVGLVEIGGAGETEELEDVSAGDLHGSRPLKARRGVCGTRRSW